MAARCLHRAQASADGRYGAYPERGSGIHTELMLERLIAFGSLPLLVVALLAAGLGVPLPEDVVLLAAGVVSHRAALRMIEAAGSRLLPIFRCREAPTCS